MKNTTIFGALDPELMERVTRRGAVTQSSKMAGALAIASMPVAFGLLAKRAFAQGTALPAPIIEVLNFALTLEYLERDFYQGGVDAGVISGPDLPIFETIRDHEAAHVTLLVGAITTGGGTPVPEPTFDFTANGSFPDPFSDYTTFKALAQGFEDTGVRAYKGQAGALMSNDAILTTALRIHSVEARHASAVRRLRGQKGWIIENTTDVPALAPVYAGEEVGAGVTIAAASAAFDEPLTKEQVLAIANLFIVP